MSDPLNSEILDVLSSIRRLVSEERKGEPGVARVFPRPVDPEAEAAADQAPASVLPRESRFVLTQALRVGSGEAADEMVDEAPDTTAGTVLPDPFADWDDDAASDDATSAGPEAGGAFVHGAASAPVAGASLETTIAELEAAVAGIETDFEPDGGDAVEAAEHPIPEETWADPVDRPRPTAGFSGIIAGYETLTLAEERLDAPITGEVMYSEPAEPFATGWLRSVPTAPQGDMAADPVVDPQDADLDSLIAAQEAEEAENAAEDLFATADTGTGDDADSALAGVGDDPELRVGGEDGSAEADAAEPDMPQAVHPSVGHLHLEAEERARPRIWRATSGDPAVQGIDLGSDPAEAGPVADDLADGEDLLDPLAGDGIDISMLRDMVVEIIREELRGTLGERITRNVRGLVRREIARVLDEELRDREADSDR